METYQAIAWPVDIIVYAKGREVERIERGPHQSHERMEAVLRSRGYEVVGPWQTKKLGSDLLSFATLRK